MWGYIVGYVARWVLFFLNAENFFRAHGMFTTPIVSLERIKEAFFLMKLGISPYDGGLCHVPPLLLWVLQPLADYPDVAFFIFTTLVDLALALAIQEFARKFQSSTNGSKRLSPMVFGLAYFLNPFTIAACLAQSLQNVHILMTTLAMVAAAHGRGGLAALFCSTSLYLGPGPVFLSFFGLGYLSHLMSGSRYSSTTYSIVFLIGCVISFVALFSSPILHHVTLRQSWDACFMHIFEVRDLEPGVGIYWYVFTQMFPRFHRFFCFIYQFHVLFYIVPIHLWIGSRGRVGAFAQVILCVAVQSLFKPYPTVIDFNYFLSLILICTDFVELSQKKFVMALSICLFCLCMLPIMNILWLIRNTGNANFFYWLQVVYFGAAEFMLTEWTTAGMKIFHKEAELTDRGESTDDKGESKKTK